jgi:YD repeat-containing protein
MYNWIKNTCFVLIILFSACDKDDSGSIYSNNSGLLYQVKFDSEPYYEYVYNASNQIVEEKSKYHYNKHNYQNGKLISSDHYVDASIFSSSSYVLDSALNRKEWVHPTNTKKSSTKIYSHDSEGKIITSVNELGINKYSYDDKNRIIRQSFYREEKPEGYIAYDYDQNNNVIKKLHYWITETGLETLRTTTEYVYDNKKNPYKAFNSLMLPGQYTNTNNIISETYTIHSLDVPASDRVHITENSYTYNSKGFPIRKNSSETFHYY